MCLSNYLFTYLPFYLFTYLPIYLFTYLPIYIFTYLSIYLPIYLSIHPSIYLSIYLYLSVCLCVCLSIYLTICKLENPATLRGFFIFPSWQHQKSCISARLPHFLKLTTSKTKQFCETSSFFEVDHIKNEAILRDFLVFQSWQHQNEALLRDFFNFSTWQHQKTKHFCRLPSKMESWVKS